MSDTASQNLIGGPRRDVLAVEGDAAGRGLHQVQGQVVEGNFEGEAVAGIVINDEHIRARALGDGFRRVRRRLNDHTGALPSTSP